MALFDLKTGFLTRKPGGFHFKQVIKTWFFAPKSDILAKPPCSRTFQFPAFYTLSRLLWFLSAVVFETRVPEAAEELVVVVRLPSCFVTGLFVTGFFVTGYSVLSETGSGELELAVELFVAGLGGSEVRDFG